MCAEIKLYNFFKLPIPILSLAVSLNTVIGNLRKDGIKPIVDELNKVAAMNAEEEIEDQVEVFLPKFKYSSHFSLRTVLTHVSSFKYFILNNLINNSHFNL